MVNHRHTDFDHDGDFSLRHLLLAGTNVQLAHCCWHDVYQRYPVSERRFMVRFCHAFDICPIVSNSRFFEFTHIMRLIIPILIHLAMGTLDI
jgi:hypothetical protein